MVTMKTEILKVSYLNSQGLNGFEMDAVLDHLIGELYTKIDGRNVVAMNTVQTQTYIALIATVEKDVTRIL